MGQAFYILDIKLNIRHKRRSAAQASDCRYTLSVGRICFPSFQQNRKELYYYCYIMDDNSLYVIVSLDRTLPECRITPCVLLTAR
jgi:hypothetical protein